MLLRSRVHGLIALLVLLLGASAFAEDEPAAPKQVGEEQAIGFLRAFVELRRAGRGDLAWMTYDGATFARRAFGSALDELDADTRALVLDLVRRGVPGLEVRAPLEWTGPGVQVDDFRAWRLKDGTTAVTFGWPGQKELPGGPLRWGVVLAPGGEGPRIVDFPFGEGESPKLGSAVLAEQIRRFRGSAHDLPTALRYYFRLPVPQTVVPKDAPVDWASPDVLVLDLQEPVIPGAPPDGWHRRRAPGGGSGEFAWVYRVVVHVARDAHAYFRWDMTRWGDAVPLRGRPVADDKQAATLDMLRRPYGPLLLRIDGRAPWSLVARIARQVPERDRGMVAFAVGRPKADGPPLRGQLGLHHGGEVPVKATRAALLEHGAFPDRRPGFLPTPAADECLAVRLGARKQQVTVKIADGAERTLPAASERAKRDTVLIALRREAKREVEEQVVERVILDVAEEASNVVRHADVLEVLGALRALEHARVDLSIPPPPERRPPDPPSLSSPPKLSWTLPAGWEARPSRFGRQLTAAPGGAKRTECYATAFAGDAGGWKANLMRWHAQMGSMVSEEDAAKGVERWPVAGASAYVAIVRGKYRAIGVLHGHDAILVGVVCMLEKHTLFVKLVGPPAEVEPELERFKALCASLRVR